MNNIISAPIGSFDKTLDSIPKFRHEGTWIAGGCVRDTILGVKYSDIDIYGISEDAIQIFKERNLAQYKMTHNDSILETYKGELGKIQLIKRYSTNMKECISQFDFTICQFACDNNFIIFNPMALMHLGRRALVVNQIQNGFELDTLRRLTKYIKKGYSICNGGIKDIATSIQKLSNEELAAQQDFYPNGNIKITRWD